MNSVYLLSASLCAAGLYIVYLHGVIRRYAEWSEYARHAIISAYVLLTQKRAEEDDEELTDD